MKNTSTVINLGIMVEIGLMPTGKTLENIITKAQTGKKTEEVEARAPVKITHNNIKIEHIRQNPTTTIAKNLT